MTRSADASALLVVDASAIVDVLAGSPRTAVAIRRALRTYGTLAAPDVLQLEVMQVLRRWGRAPGADIQGVELAFDAFKAIGVECYSHDVLIDRVWALRHSFSACDAAYVALAEGLDAPLLTTDDRLARACAGIVAIVPLQTFPD